jgi:hypothetical protein
MTTEKLEHNDCPIIIGGCHRSGTTLIRRILNAHSRIHCGPEVKFFRDFYGDYPNDELRNFRFAVTCLTLVSRPEALKILGKAFVTMHEVAARKAGKARWADKAPENVLHLQDWEEILGENWVFVHVARNPLDTIASMREIGFRRTLPETLGEQTAFYRRYTEAGIHYGQRHPLRYARVLYEQVGNLQFSASTR